MNDFIEPLESNLSIGQVNLLQRFLEDINAGRVAASPDEIEKALEVVGSLIPLPVVDLTEPDGYNTAIRVLLANLAGVYQEIDRLEAVQNALSELNTTELDRFEVAVRDLDTVLSATSRANAANTQWTDVFYETFGASVEQELDREWYKPLPVLSASGQIQSFLSLHIDPDDRALKLLPGGDFKRSVSLKGEPLCQLTLDEMLGLSVDRNHPLSQAVDGKFTSYWRELILSQAPIQADPLQVPWLPGTYSGGAAVRLHFRWPFAIPFSEIVLRPFTRYPTHVLQVIWDNRKVAVNNLIRNGSFASGGAYWASGAVTGTGFSFPTVGGYANSSFVQIVALSGRSTLTTVNFPVSGSDAAYHLIFKVKRTRDVHPQIIVSWMDAAANLVRADWDHPTLPRDEWYEYSKLFIAPSGTVAGNLVNVALVADGSGTIDFTNFSFSQTAGALTTDQQLDLEADSMSVQLDNATGTDVWLVLSQPHCEFLRVAIPEGDLDRQAVWEEVRLQAEAQGQAVVRTDQTAWLLEQGKTTTPPELLKADGSTLVKEVQRLGGRVRDMVLNMYRFAVPSTATQTLNRYLYIIGAWEIEVRHREYAPAGLFVTKPYKPRGEVRELSLLTDPPLSQLSERVHFWLTARAGDKSDKAQPFSGRATFSSATETMANPAATHFTLPPVTRRELFEGTDRLSRVALEQAPYVDRTRMWTVATQISSGSLTEPLVFDPNRDTYLLSRPGTSSLFAVTGYRPVRVTLEFADGTVSRPDSLGRVQPGDIGFAGPEILVPAVVEQELTQQGAAAPKQTRSQSTKTTPIALQTRFKNITSGPDGIQFSLYWHKSREDIIGLSTVTSGDVLISASKYSVDATDGVVTVQDTAPGGNKQYDSFVAYYYYKQGEDGSRVALDARPVASIPTSGIDFTGTLNQTFPVTRNVTDYVHGAAVRLKPANLDALDPNYYPVYEYLVDDRGRLVFADNFSSLGDRPAKITVEYESLLIEPRLIIEYAKGAINEFSSKTPILNDLTILMQSRR
jgi:hypothetical protein